MHRRFLLIGFALLAMPLQAMAAGDVKHPPQREWRFDGVLGKMDKPSVQRGLQVYKEVCAACHGIKRVPFRTLTEIGLSEAEAKALAAEYTVMDGPNDDGEMFERAGRLSDKFPSPYPNEKAARAAQNGAYPPDLSLMIKARHDGANYVHALLTGYEDAPAYRCVNVHAGKCVGYEKARKEDMEKPAGAVIVEEEAPGMMGKIFRCTDMTHGEEMDATSGNMMKVETCRELGSGLHYNPYFPGGQIAMAQPIADDQVTYQDETKASKEQIAHDVVNFLQWTAEPEMEARKRLGIKVMIFLAIMTGFFYAVKKRIWSKLEH